MRIILFLLLLNSLFSFGQETVIVDNLFTSKSIKNELSYYIDTQKIENTKSIIAKKFSSFNKNFPGVNNSKFWFRFSIINDSKAPVNLVYRINTVSFNNLTIYKKNNFQLDRYYHFNEKMQKNIEVPISLKAGNSEEYYFEVDFTKSIYFPIEIISKTENQKYNSTRQLQLGLFYGFALMVLVINVFFLINTKDTFFLYYCILLVSITFILAELDGLFYQVFGNINLIKHLDIVLHISLVIGLALFTNKAIRLQKYFPKLNHIGIAIIVLNLLCFIIYIFTDNIFWYSTGEGLNAIVLFLYWFSGFFLLKKEIYVRFLVVGYFIIFISNILYVLPSEFGLIDFGFTEGHLKIGSAIEMIVFLYAISYRYKKVEKEKTELSESLNEKIKLNEQISKSKEELLSLFIEHHQLTTRESEIVKLILKGNTNKVIAEQLDIKTTTVKYHITNVFTKLDISKRTEISYLFTNFNR